LESKLINWLIFIALSIIWGSSFILMKEGMIALTAAQVASIRIISSALVLMPVALRSFKVIPIGRMFPVFMSGVLGSLLPAYLFCIAEQGVDSALAGTLNSLTPIFVIIVGAIFFRYKTSSNKVIGIILAFTGSVLLFFFQPGFSTNSNLGYVLMIVLATLFYGINVNLVHKYLGQIRSLNVVSVSLFLNMFPALIVLFFTGFFQLNFEDKAVLFSSGYSFILGIFGTALASVIFYMLIKRAGVVFASMVTYAIPIVANIWGVIYGEHIGWKQIFCMGLLLAGVYVANRSSGKEGAN
jgi:drug/metabolite transporter (DMT)-like permease